MKVLEDHHCTFSEAPLSVCHIHDVPMNIW